MQKISVVAGILFSAAVCADSTENYRSPFIERCVSEDPEPQAAQMCACVFDNWQAGLASKTDRAAIVAAKLMVNDEAEVYPSEMMAASQLMQSMGDISSQCADKVLGKIKIGGSVVDSQDQDYPSSEDYPVAYPTESEVPSEGKKRGLFGAVVGWAGQKAGLPDMVNDAAADKADENESTIKDKLNPLKSKFNPFKKNKDEDASE